MPFKTAILAGDGSKQNPMMSQAVVYNGLVYCSGSLGIDPATGKFVEGTVADRAKQALMNLQSVLQAAGTDLKNAIKVNIFLSSMDHYAVVNEVYAKVFQYEVNPCRTCVEVAKLPRDAELEIELVAHL